MDRILTNDNEANDEFGPIFSSFLNPSESNFFDNFSNAVDDGIGCDNKNDNIASTEKFSGSFVDTGNCTSDVSSKSCGKNEVLENGDDSLVAEKNLSGDAVKNFEKGTDNVCGSRNGDTSLINDEILDSDHQNKFVPSIVKIRGGRSDVLEQADQSSSTSLHYDVSSFTPPEVSSLNIVDVLDGCEDIQAGNEIIDNTCISDIIVERNPPNNVFNNDCVHSGTNCCRASFSSEFFNEEETVNAEVENPVEICSETTSKLPSFISSRKESSIEAVSQPNSSQNETCSPKKRFTRSSLFKSNDRIILSSSSNLDILSDSKKRSQLPKNTSNSSGGYSCYVCNAVFRKNKLLNEHMIQQHNSNLIEKKGQNRPKTTKLKLYSCDICKRELSTSQSLKQHVLIHKNVKPFGCHICEKDFRHLSNYRMHLQKHKVEQRHRDEMQQANNQEHLGERVVRNVDFDRLVGPLCMKKNLELVTINRTNRSLRNETSSSIDLTEKTTFKPFHSTNESSCRPQLSFDQPPLKIKENTTSSISSAVIIRRQVSSSDSISEEECGAAKSFKNIENVAMNTSKIIVNLDNLDASVLKRKLLTPDISIDQPSKKCKVRLSPIAEKYNINIDEIENIPMDLDPREIDLPSVEQIEDDQFDNYLNENNEIETVGDSVNPPYDSLSDNELFSLLNDDRDILTATTISVDLAGDSNWHSGQILQPECNEVDTTKTAILPNIEQSNGISVETSLSYEMSAYEDEIAIDDKLDAFDTAFHKVATRRLALLRKRAAENEGKVESRYLLGPLFWCKVLRRAQKCVSAVSVGSSGNTKSDIAFGGSNAGSLIGDSPKTCAGLECFGSRSSFDDPLTNDPIKLQSRAESKFKCLLKQAKIVENLNALNLAGPLFWRRTLQLAGIHCGEDLRTLMMNVTLPNLEGVEFVGDDGKPCDFDVELVSAEQQTTPQPSTLDLVLASDVSTFKSDYRQSNDQLLHDRLSPLIASDVKADDLFKPFDQILSPVVPAEQSSPISDDAATNSTLNDVLSVKTDTILCESLTKLNENQQQSVELHNLLPSDVNCGDLFVINPNNSAISSLCSNSQTEMPENYSNNKYNEFSGDAMVAVEENGWPSDKLDTNYSSSIVLNVDCDESPQLIPVNNYQVTIPEAGHNFILLSDESGIMQFVVNAMNENNANFELIGDSGYGDKVVYAIQFDGENYTAVQFVQDENGIHLQSDSSLNEALQLDSKAATYLVSNTSAPTTVVSSNPVHIGLERSDF